MSNEDGQRQQPVVPSSDELLRAVIESSTDFAIIAQTSDGTVTSWNIGAERLLGWTEEEIVGRDGDVIFTPEDRAAGESMAERARARRESRAENERWHQRKDGSRFWGSGFLMPLRGDTGGFVKIMRDRTGQRLAEEAARESREQLEAVFAQAAVGMARTDTSGRFTLINDRYCEMLGRSREDLLALRMQDLTHPDDRPANLALFERLVATGEPFVTENRYLCPDEAVVWVSNAVSLARGPEGAPLHLIAVSQDITERRLADERLRETEARFRTLATNIPQLVFRSRVTGERTWGSPQWEVFTGLSDPVSRALGWLEAIHPDDREATLAAWRTAEETGSYYVEHRVRRVADGQYRWHQTRATPLRGVEPRSAEWVGTSADIHELRGLQDRQRVLLAELQHRTRNLLAVVQAVARQTLRTSSSLQEFATEYERRLRALSRVQGLLASTTGETLDLGTLVGTELRAHGAGAGGKVQVEGPHIELPTASVQTLALALHELATNAVKYGALREPQGQLAVTWRVERSDGQQRRLVLDWRESGVAMKGAAAPKRKGYGTELIERALPYQLKAETRLEFGDDGVRCSIAVPIATDQEANHG